MAKWKSLSIALLAIFSVTNNYAMPYLASARVGFLGATWYDAFGFKLNELSITPVGNNTEVVTSLPNSVIQPEDAPYEEDNAIRIATLGRIVNGAINFHYMITLFVGSASAPRWVGSPVSATVKIPFVNGQIPKDFSQLNVNAETTCKVTPMQIGGASFIRLFCQVDPDKLGFGFKA